MSDTLPIHIAAIPYLRDRLSAEAKTNPTASYCDSLKPCGSTQNKDGSISHNYTASMILHGDGGELKEKVAVSLVEKDGTFTLVKGNATESQSTFVDGTVTKNSPRERPLEKDAVVNGISREALTEQYQAYDRGAAAEAAKEAAADAARGAAPSASPQSPATGRSSGR